MVGMKKSLFGTNYCEKKKYLIVFAKQDKEREKREVRGY